MADCGEFAERAPDLADFGVQRFGTRVAYLATTRRNGPPRVHPVTPIIARERLFVFMDDTSPKGHDLLRDQRYAIHCSVADDSGSDGEFSISGRAVSVDDPALRSVAAEAAPYDVLDSNVLFELTNEQAGSTVYERGQPKRARWKEAT